MILFIFWFSLCFVVYTYLIYPALIVTISYLKINPVNSFDNDYSELPSITMIIVVRNEENRVMDKLSNCREINYPEDLLEICFVSDGSTDGTNEILNARQDITFFEEPEHLGKPAQLNNAVSRTNGDFIVFSDVRQKYGKDTLLKLINNFKDPEIGAVSGELHLDETGTSTSRNIGLYWKYEKMIRKAESRLDSTVGVSGAIYAIRRNLFEPIPEDTILDDIEIPLNIIKKGYRVIFDSGAVAYDISHSDIRREWERKVRTLTGNFQLFRRNVWLFNPFKNRIFIQALSHKFFRLLIPYALMVILITSSIVEGITFKIFFTGQIIAYSLGVAGLLFGNLNRISLVNLFSVFISLNSAAVVAFYKYAFGKADVKWKE